MDPGVVMDSVKKMLDSGIEVSVVKSTLSDLGLSDSEIDSVIRQVKGGGSPETASSSQKPVPAPAFTSAKDVPVSAATLSETIVAQQQMHNLSQATTQAALESHQESLSHVDESMAAISAKLDSLSQNMGGNSDWASKLSLIQNRLSALEHDVTEVKAQGSAIQSLLTKVLETNRDALMELQRLNNR